MAKTNDELMNQHLNMIHFLKDTVWKVEGDLKRMKTILSRLERFDVDSTESLDLSEDMQTTMWSSESRSYEEDDMQVVEWHFDWYFMVWPEQKKYPVHPNYASKTKLVPWDMLKLRILPDGKFIYKLVRPVERRNVWATLSKNEDGKFIAVTDDSKIYFLNQAAVTFFGGKPWDKIYILVNWQEERDSAAIEAIITS